LNETTRRSTLPPDSQADPDNPESPLHPPVSTRPLPRRIVLTGFMAAGKTTVGRTLAQQLDWPFRDVDAEIEASTGLSVPDIFRIHGEPHFRELEQAAIHRLLAANPFVPDPLILALGGGAIENPHTRALLLGSPSIHLVNLEASLEITLARSGPTGSSTRPVFADLASLEARYYSRLPLYRQAHQTIHVDEIGPTAVAQAILLHLHLSPKP
jgi:shikimate kinase